MKASAYLLLLSVLFCAEVDAQNTAKYWIESTDLDSLVVISNGNQETYKGFKENTYFNVERTSNQPVYLKPYCNKSGCRDSVSIKLWGKKEDAYTSWIYLKPQDSISIDSCFIKYPEESFLSRTYQSSKERAIAFWESVSGKGRVISGQKSVLKGGEVPAPDEPKLSFTESDYFRFRQLANFQLSFEVADKYPLKSIYIIGHNGELLFCSGDCSLVREVFPKLTQDQTPNLSAIITAQPTTETLFKAYEINMEKIKSHLLDKIKLGEWYQLGIELENDKSDFNPYLFNFQFFTPEELKRMDDFGN